MGTADNQHQMSQDSPDNRDVFRDIFLANRKKEVEARQKLRDEFVDMEHKIGNALMRDSRFETAQIGLLYLRASLFGNTAKKYIALGERISELTLNKSIQSAQDMITECCDRGAIQISDELKACLQEKTNSSKPNRRDDAERRVNVLQESVRRHVATLVAKDLPSELRNEGDINAIMAKVRRAPLGQDASRSSLDRYAYRTTVNFITDRLRAGERRQRHEKKGSEKVEQARDFLVRHGSAIEEFDTIRADILNDPRKYTVSNKFAEWLQMLDETVLRKRDVTASDWNDRYPDANANVRYQWVRRGRMLLWPHISENLKTFLSEGMWAKEDEKGRDDDEGGDISR